MKLRSAVLFTLVAAIACLLQTEASAAGRRAWANQQPATPMTTPATILPSPAEVMAVPVPQAGRVIAYPVDVVRYGLNVHPGARLVRGIFAR
jgi:hypothetical protein